MQDPRRRRVTWFLVRRNGPNTINNRPTIQLRTLLETHWVLCTQIVVWVTWARGTIKLGRHTFQSCCPISVVWTKTRRRKKRRRSKRTRRRRNWKTRRWSLFFFSVVQGGCSFYNSVTNVECHVVQGFYEVQSTTWNVWCLWKGPPSVPLIQGLFFGWDFGVFARSFRRIRRIVPCHTKDWSVLFILQFARFAFAGTTHDDRSWPVVRMYVYSVLVVFHNMKELTTTKKSSCSETQFNM